MEIRIHRGANQIGGCITEIKSGNCRVFIDLGSNLPGSEGQEFSEEEIINMTSGADAIFYTHIHGDHIGLRKYVPSSILQYIGSGAKKVLACQLEALKKFDELEKLESFKTYEVGKKIDAGGKGLIFVTPYTVSHSAFDSYMLKIECEGKVILHTGDFRKHGYLGKGLLLTLERYVKQVDLIITEGTMLGRRSENVITENDIQRNVSNYLRTHKYVFALCSSTDIDRLAGFKEACIKNGRNFVVSKYQNEVLEIFTNYAEEYNRKYRKKNELYYFKNSFVLFNAYARSVIRRLGREGFLMPITPSMLDLVKYMKQTYSEQPSYLIYSMWQGYAEEGKSYSNAKIIELRKLFDGNILDGVKDGVHTSGHADVETLAEVCRIINPRLGIIPIHKDNNDDIELHKVFAPYKIFTEAINVLDGVTVYIS